jgi:hypothetical protein
MELLQIGDVYTNWLKAKAGGVFYQTRADANDWSELSVQMVKVQVQDTISSLVGASEEPTKETISKQLLSSGLSQLVRTSVSSQHNNRDVSQERRNMKKILESYDLYKMNSGDAESIKATVQIYNHIGMVIYLKHYPSEKSHGFHYITVTYCDDKDCHIKDPDIGKLFSLPLEQLVKCFKQGYYLAQEY